MSVSPEQLSAWLPAVMDIADAAGREIMRIYETGFSSHSFGAPKEQEQFWRELAKVEHFEPARSLFVDDSLPVLRAARAAGIGLIYAVQRPDSDGPARLQSEFPAVDAVAQLL